MTDTWISQGPPDPGHDPPGQGGSDFSHSELLEQGTAPRAQDRAFSPSAAPSTEENTPGVSPSKQGLGGRFVAGVRDLGGAVMRWGSPSKSSSKKRPPSELQEPHGLRQAPSTSHKRSRHAHTSSSSSGTPMELEEHTTAPGEDLFASGRDFRAHSIPMASGNSQLQLGTKGGPISFLSSYHHLV